MRIETESKSIFRIAIIIALSSLAIFNAGFDNNSVYWNALMLIAFMMFFLAKKGKGYEFDLKNPILPYVVFSIWGIISMFWTISHLRTLIEFIQMFSYGLIFLMAYYTEEDDFLEIGKVLVLITSLIALLGIGEYIFSGAGRIKSTFSNPNPFGIFMAMMFLATWGYGLRKKSRLLNLASIIMLTTVILTGSRASMIALLIGLPFVFLGIERENIAKAVGKTAVLVLMGILLVQPVAQLSSYMKNQEVNAEKVMDSTLNSTLRASSFKEVSVDGRLAFWKTGAELISNRPVNGYGLGSFFSAYYIEYNMDKWYSRYAHNHYIQVGAELGIVGIVLFLTFVGNAVLKMFGNIRRGCKSGILPGLLASSIAFLAHIGVDFSWNFPAVTALFFAMIGFGTKIGSKQVKKGKKNTVVKQKSLIALLIVLFTVTAWQLISLNMFTKASNMAESDIESSNRMFATMNKIYPISHVGKSLESDNYSSLYLSDGKREHLEKAISLLEEAIELAPYDSGIHRKLGDLYHESGDIESAEKHLESSVRYGAYSIDNHLNLGVFYIETDRKEEVESLFLKALKLEDPAIIRAKSGERDGTVFQIVQMHLYLANLYENSEKAELSKQHTDRIEELMEEYPDVGSYFG